MKVDSASELEESVKMAAKYIRQRQIPDGGYFFARVSPGSLQDTYFAVKSLRMLGHRPHRISLLEHFIQSFQSEYVNGNIHSLYLATGILLELDKSTNPYHPFGEVAMGHFNLEELHRFEKLDVEVVSELKQIFEAVTLFTTLGIRFDQQSVIEFILSLFNKDGGLGRNQHSTLATTYYGVATLASMNYRPRISELTLDFLQSREKEAYFIEDLYYLMMARTILCERPSYTERENGIPYVLGYQRASGGFARSRIIGISTLEYTYYAISLYKLLEAI